MYDMISYCICNLAPCDNQAEAEPILVEFPGRIGTEPHSGLTAVKPRYRKWINMLEMSFNEIIKVCYISPVYSPCCSVYAITAYEVVLF